jgi:hypothetical protein
MVRGVSRLAGGTASVFALGSRLGSGGGRNIWALATPVMALTIVTIKTPRFIAFIASETCGLDQRPQSSVVPAGTHSVVGRCQKAAVVEVSMNDRDEMIRGKLLDRLTAVSVDARNLVVEVAAGMVTVRGAVPTEEERSRAIEALIGAHTLEISVRASAGSARQSQHQTDPN